MKLADRIPFRVRPMLATLVDKPFNEAGWIYEEKYDGYRLLAYKEGSRVTLLSRNAKDRTQTFSPIVASLAALSAHRVLLDGEAVAFDRRGVSRFQLLQNQGCEPRFAVFDCLYKDGVDLRSKPLSVRRSVLESVIGNADPNRARVFLSAMLASNGLRAFEIAKRKGCEGVVAKNGSASYIEGRPSQWLKFKVRHEDEFIVVGYTAPAGSRQYFGALLLGAYDHGKLRYVGKVGTGFTRESLARLFRAFQSLVKAKPSLTSAPRQRNIVYLAPKLIAQVAFEEWTNDQKLRQPVFLGLRDDKKPREITIPEAQ
jgi:bifunctional non-homologous end joining protein LigD